MRGPDDPTPAPGTRCADGFTLIEALVVIIIISVLASVAVPRFVNTASRMGDAEADGVQRLLSMAAQKAVLSGRRVRIMYDAAGQRLELQVFRDTPDAPSGTAASAGSWAPDPLVEPAPLTQLKIRQVWIDGRPVRPEAFRVPFSPGEARPDIGIVLERRGETAGSTIEVALTPDATEATRSGQRVVAGRMAAAAGGGAAPRSIDLDDTGWGGKPW